MKIKVLGYLLGGALVSAALSVGLLYTALLRSQNEFLDYKERQYREYLTLLETKAEIEANHLLDLAAIDTNLKEIRKSYENTITNMQSDHTDRVQYLEQRIEAYNRLSEVGGDSFNCGALAEHTAGLDRTLERGRYLVIRLGETIRYRDSQLNELGKVIETDRKLISDFHR